LRAGYGPASIHIHPVTEFSNYSTSKITTLWPYCHLNCYCRNRQLSIAADI